VFAVQPSTRGHLESGETPLYIAPNGTMRGFVDYRVRIPNGSSSGNRTIQWSLTDHEIEEIRLQKDGETIARTDGSHTPAIDYQIDDDWSATLSLEAEIHVRLKKTIRTDVVNGTNVDVVYREETRNVSDSIDVEVYDLSAYPITPNIRTRIPALPSSSPVPGRGTRLLRTVTREFVVSGDSTLPETPIGTRLCGPTVPLVPK